MRPIEDLHEFNGDAYDYFKAGGAEAEIFKNIFLADDTLDAILNKNKYLLIGEKGSGKSAYAVYYSKFGYKDTNATIKLVSETVYQKFVSMKKQKSFEISTYKDIWINIILLVIAESIKSQIKGSILQYFNYKNLSDAITSFYNNAFAPEFINALEFVNNTNSSISFLEKHGLFGGNCSTNNTVKGIEQNYNINLMKICEGLKRALFDINLKNDFILFIDGIDARPDEVDQRTYLECISGLTNAIVELSTDYLKELCNNKSFSIKTMLLVRPDIIYKMPIHNLNQKVRYNSVLLDWNTSYLHYRSSKLFNVADNYFSKQQIDSDKYKIGECWDSYLPYKISDLRYGSTDDSFIDFLRYSTYKPRDILTMIQDMKLVHKGQDTNFKPADFKNAMQSYSLYMLGELKDYMLIYLNREEFSIFISVFNYFKHTSGFHYNWFCLKFNNYQKDIIASNRRIPNAFNTADKLLQLLYDVNIIGFSKCKDDYETHWSFKERNYAVIQPEVDKNCYYRFHRAYLKALKIF